MKTMEYVRTFLFRHGLMGQGATSPNVVGIAFPDGKILGDKRNVKFRYTSDFMRMAAAKKL